MVGDHMGLKDIQSPLHTIAQSIPPIAETIKKYRIIYIGYVISMGIFVATSVFEVFEAPGLINFLYNYNLDKIVFATMLFSVFMIIYFVREQERMKYEQGLEEQKRVKEGIWLAEQEIRNQIIMINQATFMAEKKGELTGDMINVIRDNTRKMEKQLELLQKSDWTQDTIMVSSSLSSRFI